ncbi:hypothetical protein BDV27DRAFT_94106 [Aspergillus caelatus]|uniref:Uncharacterized protein n=2 Tax=Aspergillus subgen. Circumdati TaxID=2720871 RepID=A0A5N7A9A0_9EURO|nr:uncharacterized protein BDV27DRAFT_94106 [Aspergillus caelatus]KAE8160072.1 hypothetical protein BDV40DRAFT_302604 [Aspergillus tamarii]KAE8366223.1 hypothetical protein BDV27DRAFT_94106 [Aspergillus caelatus]
MSVEIAQFHGEIEALVEKFDVLSKIKEIQEGGDVRSSVPVTISVTTDATISLLEDKSTISESTEAPKSLSNGDKASFKITQGDELKYTVTAGGVTADFKIVFDVDKSAPKLKLSDELEADDAPIGFETTKTETKTEIEIEREVEVEKEWTKGKKPERKTSKETKHEAKAGPYSLQHEVETKFKQEKDKSEAETETEIETSSKTVVVEYVIY